MTRKLKTGAKVAISITLPRDTVDFLDMVTAGGSIGSRARMIEILVDSHREWLVKHLEERTTMPKEQLYELPDIKRRFEWNEN